MHTAPGLSVMCLQRSVMHEINNLLYMFPVLHISWLLMFIHCSINFIVVGIFPIKTEIDIHLYFSFSVKLSHTYVNAYQVVVVD